MKNDFNPHHEPAGKVTGGQFASAPGMSSERRESLVRSAERADQPTVQDMDKWQADCLEDDEFSVAEMDVMQDYTNNDYRAINAYLRGEGPSYQSDLKRISVMDGLFERVSLSRDALVYRGMSAKRYNQIAKAKDGTVFEDKAFVSTSVSRKVAAEFGKRAGKSIRIALKKGAKALPLGSASYDNRNELEVLIGSGQRFVKQSLPDGTPVLEVS